MTVSLRAAQLAGAMIALSAGVALQYGAPVEAVFFGYTKNHIGLHNKRVGETGPWICPNVYFDWTRQGVGFQIDAPRNGADPNASVGGSYVSPCASACSGFTTLSDKAKCVLKCDGNWKPHYVPSYSWTWLHKPRSWAPSGTGKEHPDWKGGHYAPMDAWEKEDVMNMDQDSMSFTILNKPHKDAVRFIAVFANGQEGCEGYPQTTTGTNEGWKTRINEYAGLQSKKNQKPTKKWHSGPASLDKRGAASIFMDGFRTPAGYGEDLRVYDLDTTLVVAITDHAFSYPGQMTSKLAGPMKGCNGGNAQWKNNRILRGWKRWLNHNVWWGNIQGFFGYGMSRGGCFVTRLADLLFSTVPELTKNKYKTTESDPPKWHVGTKLILETVDAVCNPVEWQDGVSSRKKYTPDAIRSPYNFIWSDYTFNPVRERTFRQWHPQHLSAGVPRSRCNGIHVNKLFGQTKRENIRWLNSVAGGDVLEWGNTNLGLEIFSFCEDRTATSTFNDVIRNSGIKNTVWHAPISTYQNLLVRFDNTAVHDGPVSTAAMFSQVSPNNADDMVTYQPSNNPMPEDCDAWYKQVWVPVTHAFIGSAFTQENVLDVKTNEVPCWGMSSCGYGTKQTWKSDPNYSPLPSFYSPWLTTCKPNPRADLDYVYKHMRHAANAASEWFPLGKPTRTKWIMDGPITGWRQTTVPNEKYRPAQSCAQRPPTGPSSDEPAKSNPWDAKFLKQVLGECVEDDIDEEDGGVLSTCKLVVNEEPLGDAVKDTACGIFKTGGKLTDLIEDEPVVFAESPNAYEDLYRSCSPGTDLSGTGSEVTGEGSALEAAYQATFNESEESQPSFDAPNFDGDGLDHIPDEITGPYYEAEGAFAAE